MCVYAGTQTDNGATAGASDFAEFHCDTVSQCAAAYACSLFNADGDYTGNIGFSNEFSPMAGESNDGFSANDGATSNSGFTATGSLVDESGAAAKFARAASVAAAAKYGARIRMMWDFLLFTIYRDCSWLGIRSVYPHILIKFSFLSTLLSFLLF